MKLLFSPSKTMMPATLPSQGQPIFLEEAKIVQEALAKALKAQGLTKFYRCSEKKAKALAEVQAQFTFRGTSPAIYSFSGVAFRHLHPQSLDKGSLTYLKNNLLIFSGLYGFLRPFDAISPYRLDYDNPLKVGGVSLKTYWKDKLYHYLKGESLIINLASKEYASSLLASDLNLISIDFKLQKDGRKLITSHESKVARGECLRLLALSEAESIADIIALCPNGYRYSARDSSQENLVFIKKVT